MTVHDFDASLAKSHKYQDAYWWEDVYRKAFPTLVSMQDIRDDGWSQRAGIDRRLHLADGSSLSVDEKVRYQDYGDILLEVWSDCDRKQKGWIQKELAIDYLAYAVAPTATVYLFPFRLLQQAWNDNKKEWAARACDPLDSGFRVVDARNQSRGRGWVTRSVAVPLDSLLDAMRDCMVVQWDAA